MKPYPPGFHQHLLMVSVFSMKYEILTGRGEWECGEFEAVCQEVLIVHLRFEILDLKLYQSASFCDFFSPWHDLTD